MYAKSKTASFDVDAQKTFTPLCPNELPVAEGDLIGSALNDQATLARIRVGSKDAHTEKAAWVATPEQPMFSNVGLPNSDIRWNRHAEIGTPGFELLNDLPQPSEYDYFVWKGVEPDMHPYGACYHTLNWKQNKLSTGVIEYLKCAGIENVIVGGLATDYCVRNTALQLRDAGFQVILNLAACRGIDASTIKQALEEMSQAGVLLIENVMDNTLFFDDVAQTTFSI